MIIGVDFDGVIVRVGKPGAPLVLLDGADKALRALVAAGHRLVLHSVRGQAPITELLQAGVLRKAAIPPQFVPDAEEAPLRFREMRDFLRSRRLWTLDEGGVFEGVWTLPGKPYCDVYLDDRAVQVRGPGALLAFAATCC